MKLFYSSIFLLFGFYIIQAQTSIVSGLGFTQDLAVKGDRLYVSGNSGISRFDLADVSNTQEIVVSGTSFYHIDASENSAVIYVNRSISNGVGEVAAFNANNNLPTGVSTITGVTGPLRTISNSNGSLVYQDADSSNGGNNEVLYLPSGAYTVNYAIYHMAVVGNELYLSTSDNDIKKVSLDVNNTAMPTVVRGNIPAFGLAEANGWLYYTEVSTNNVWRINLADNTRSQVLNGSNNTTEYYNSIEIYQNRIFLTRLRGSEIFEYVDPSLPSCDPATNLQIVNSTATSAFLNWTPSTLNPGTYEVAVSSGNPPSYVAAGTNSNNYNFTNLTDGTTYTFYVRKTCSNGIISESTLIFTLQAASTTNIIYVDKDATGANDGTSWTDAFTELRDALLVDQMEDEIWIAQGVYTPRASISSQNDRDDPFVFSEDNSSFYGGFSGNETAREQRDPSANPTVLSGDVNGNDIPDDFSSTKADNLFTVALLSGNNVTLDGLVIENGFAIGTVNGSVRRSHGGGLIIDNNVDNLKISNCIFRQNLARNGGAAIFTRTSGGMGTRNILIDRCLIKNNTAAYGAGIYAFTDNSGASIDLDVKNSIFTANASEIQPSATFFYAGSSMWLRGAGSGTNFNVLLDNNTFYANRDDNNSSSNGGAPAYDFQDAVTVGLSDEGGSMSSIVSNCIFTDNTSSVNNSLTGGVGKMVSTASSQSIQVRNSSHHTTNASNQAFPLLSRASVQNSLVGPVTFEDVAMEDFAPVMGSAVIDSGLNETSTLDYFGNKRVANGTVDMGAVETSSTAPQQFTLTVNVVGNGTVVPLNTIYDENETVTLYAAPDSGFEFVEYTGDVTSSNATESIVMDADKIVTATFDVTAGLVDEQIQKLRIFPNPTNGEVHVETKAQIKRIDIYSLTGRKLETFRSGQFSIENLPTGMYLVSVIDADHNVYSERLIKN
ncbi:MAG: T9SS type A sorting domain-containing protein [Nonlabens sp.]